MRWHCEGGQPWCPCKPPTVQVKSSSGHHSDGSYEQADGCLSSAAQQPAPATVLPGGIPVGTRPSGWTGPPFMGVPGTMVVILQTCPTVAGAHLASCAAGAEWLERVLGPLLIPPASACLRRARWWRGERRGEQHVFPPGRRLVWPCPAQLYTFQGPDMRLAMRLLASTLLDLCPSLCLARVTSREPMEEKSFKIPAHWNWKYP